MTQREYINVVNLERLRQAAESLRQTIGLTTRQNRKRLVAYRKIEELVEDLYERVDRQMERGE